MGWFEAAIRWYGVLFVATWAWAPAVRLLCGGLADRGALLARPLALLATVYPVWLVSSLGFVPYSTVGLWVVLVAAGTIGWAVVARRGMIDRPWLRSLVVAEGVSLVAFGAYVWLRGYTPDILGTEKPMEIAFLASSARAVAMPPPDPWFAGEPINYYYLGYLLHGAVARMAGVAATTGFNLALATTFAATVTAAVGVGYDAARPWLGRRPAVVSGAFVAVLLVLLGNLYAAVRLLRAPAETLGAGWAEIGWRSSRIVCDGPRVEDRCPDAASGRILETINEFPFFSFLLGDLHPHLLALPFVVVSLGLALNLALRGRGPAVAAGWGERIVIAVSGAVVGALYALNSWDFPTYLVVAVAALLGGIGLADRRRAATATGILLAAAVGAWLPFVLRFVPPTGPGEAQLPTIVRDFPLVPGLLSSFGPYRGERTSVGEFLTIFGVPYAIALWFIGAELRRRGGSGKTHVPPRSAVLVVLGLLGLAVLLPAPVLALCGVPLAATLLLLRDPEPTSPRKVATLLFGLGFALALVVELVYVRDVFDSRMNTLFKVYFQVWTLWGVGTALALVLLWREERPRGWSRPALVAVAALAIAAGAVYPALAAYRWTGGFADWRGLDGVAYVGRTAADELAAIRWLQANADQDDVLLEAAGCSYYPLGKIPFNRASAYSGVPTVIGWAGHERQWRNGREAWLAGIGARSSAVGDLFAEPSSGELDGYGVTLLYVGRYERAQVDPTCPSTGPYAGVGEAGYPGAGWEVAFDQGETRIFRRSEPVTADRTGAAAGGNRAEAGRD